MNNTVITNEDYEELSGHLEYLGATCNLQEKELRYMHDFISWMHLETMYDDFRKNAYEFHQEDGSLSYYTMNEERIMTGIVCS